MQKIAATAANPNAQNLRTLAISLFHFMVFWESVLQALKPTSRSQGCQENHAKSALNNPLEEKTQTSSISYALPIIYFINRK
jgi:hypothetical protein